MKRQLTPLICVLALTSVHFAVAETLSFKEHNFAVDLPEGWTTTEAPAPAVGAAKNADGEKMFVFVAAQIPEKERATAVRDMGGAAKDASKKKGWTISAERQVTINGIKFDSYAAQVPGGATVISWMTSAGSEAYSLQGIHKNGEASSDPEIQSIMNSFRLLSPAPATIPSYDPNSVAYKFGRLIGGPCSCIFVLGLLVLAGLGIVWFIRRKKTKQ